MRRRQQPPVGIQLNVALAVDALELADDGLSAALAALGGTEISTAPADPFCLQGWLATVRHFGCVFDPIKGERFVPMGVKIRERIEAMPDGPNLPGLRRALSAIEFAAAAFDDASDDAEAAGVGDHLCDGLLAAVSCLDGIAVSLESSLVRPHGGFSSN